MFPTSIWAVSTFVWMLCFFISGGGILISHLKWQGWTQYVRRPSSYSQKKTTRPCQWAKSYAEIEPTNRPVCWIKMNSCFALSFLAWHGSGWVASALYHTKQDVPFYGNPSSHSFCFIKGETEVRVRGIFCLMLDYDVVVKNQGLDLCLSSAIFQLSHLCLSIDHLG